MRRGEDLTSGTEDKLLDLKHDKLDPAVRTESSATLQKNRLNPAENTAAFSFPSLSLVLTFTSHTEALAEFIPSFHSTERILLTIDH